MLVAELKVNEEQALSRLIRFLSIEGITGQEKGVADAVFRDLVESGVPKSDMKFDTANEKIELPCQTTVSRTHADQEGRRPAGFQERNLTL